MDQRPIGLYDSGAGGLSVLRALHRLLPRESFVYLADTARFPYGERSPQEILSYNREIIGALRRAYDVKALVVACNTSSALALPTLQPQTDVPLIGMIEAGSQSTIGRRRLGLIATNGTINSGAYLRAIAYHNPGAEVLELACPRLVTLAEAANVDPESVARIVRRSLAPLLDQGLDGLLLGCTHYPLLEGAIRQVMGPEVELIDPARYVAIELYRYLRSANLLSLGRTPSYCHFIATGPGQHLQALVDRYLDGLERPALAFDRGHLKSLGRISVA